MMPNPFRWLVLAAVVLTGCAATPAVTALEPAAVAGGEGNYWWAARFAIAWPESEAPAWHLDALLAHRVVAPTLARNREGIPLWRFHRRAVRDEAGHQFSFIFYASPGTARAVFAELGESPVLGMLQDAGEVERLAVTDLAQPDGLGVADTSDDAWAPPIQQAWPHFIMGASQAWLGLIEQVAVGVSPEETAETLSASYAEVNEQVQALWRDQGGHAFLHHLNALFGYRPVWVHRSQQLRF